MRTEWLAPELLDQMEPSDRVLFLLHVACYEEALPACAGRRVLEVGCGAGYGASLLARGATRYVGVDPDREAVLHARVSPPLPAGPGDARGSGDAPGPSPAFLQADPLDGLPFADGAFEVVVLFQVYEHIAPGRAADFLRELRRVLAPGGRLLLTTPNRRLRLLPLQRPWNPYHTRELDARGLRRELEGVFGDVEVLALRGSPGVEAIERARIRPHRSAVRAYLVDPLRWLASLLRLGSLSRRLGLKRGSSVGGEGPGASPRSPDGGGSRDGISFSTGDFRLEPDDLDAALTLYAVARRRGTPE